MRGQVLSAQGLGRRDSAGSYKFPSRNIFEDICHFCLDSKNRQIYLNIKIDLSVFAVKTKMTNIFKNVSGRKLVRSCRVPATETLSRKNLASHFCAGK